jgi:hypothetical protein
MGSEDLLVLAVLSGSAAVVLLLLLTKSSTETYVLRGQLMLAHKHLTAAARHHLTQYRKWVVAGGRPTPAQNITHTEQVFFTKFSEDREEGIYDGLEYLRSREDSKD